MNKNLFFLLAFFFSFTFSKSAQTQEVARATPGDSLTPAASELHTSEWIVRYSSLVWNEDLKIIQAGIGHREIANYAASAFEIGKEFLFQTWGWNASAFIGSGKANGAGTDASVSYTKNTQNFSILGLNVGAFYRISERIHVGLGALALNNSLVWPDESPTVTVEAKPATAFTVIADMSLRLTDHFDFQMGIGHLINDGTFWKIGASYRF